MKKILNKKVVYKNKWIKITNRKIEFLHKKTSNFYSIDQKDYVCILLQTENNLFPMVKQYRHAIGKYTLEFPSGLLDYKETPIDCAKKEVLEETGHKVIKLIKLSTLYPDSGRLSNKVHMFFAKAKDKKVKEISELEEIKVSYHTKKQIEELIKKNKILHQQHIGLFYSAIIKNLI
jgi:ADP-ribose pyrophosphatase